MLKQTNSTAITLIPKVICPQSLNDFRPISCCNVIYKMISKILSGRLKGILTDIIQLNQLAFIPRRKIADNVLLAHKLLELLGMLFNTFKLFQGLDQIYRRVKFFFLRS